MAHHAFRPAKTSIIFTATAVVFIVVAATTAKATTSPTYPIVGELTTSETIPIGFGIGGKSWTFSTPPDQNGALVFEPGDLGPDTLGGFTSYDLVGKIPVNATINSAHLTIIPNYRLYQYPVDPVLQSLVSASTGKPCTPPECAPTIPSIVGAYSAEFDTPCSGFFVGQSINITG